MSLCRKRNGDNQAQEPGWEGRKKGIVRDLAHTHHKQTGRKCQEKPIFTNLKKRFKHVELPAKLLDYFLRSSKSNINQLTFYKSNQLNRNQRLQSSHWLPNVVQGKVRQGRNQSGVARGWKVCSLRSASLAFLRPASFSFVSRKHKVPRGGGDFNL